MSKLIPLNGKNGQGKFAIVDDQDYEHLMQWSWQIHTSHVCRKVWNNGSPRAIFMHHEVLDIPSTRRIDHENRNGLDNQKHNLRFATHSQNMANRARYKSKKTSQYKGIYFVKRNTKRPWRASVTCQGKTYYAGTFDTQEKAARAYDAKAKELFGEFACTNF